MGNKIKKVNKILKRYGIDNIGIDESNSVTIDEKIGTIRFDESNDIDQLQKKFDEINELKLMDRKSRIFESRIMKLAEEYGFTYDFNNADEILGSIEDELMVNFDNISGYRSLTRDEVVDIMLDNDIEIDTLSIEMIDNNVDGTTTVSLIDGSTYLIQDDFAYRIDESRTKAQLIEEFDEEVAEEVIRLRKQLRETGENRIKMVVIEDGKPVIKDKSDKQILADIKKSVRAYKNKKVNTSEDDYQEYNEALLNDDKLVSLPSADEIYRIDENVTIGQHKPTYDDASMPVNEMINHMDSTELKAFNEMIKAVGEVGIGDEFANIGEETDEPYDAYLDGDYDKDTYEKEKELDRYNEQLLADAGVDDNDIINNIDEVANHIIDGKVAINKEKRLFNESKDINNKKSDSFIERLSRRSFF